MKKLLIAVLLFFGIVGLSSCGEKKPDTPDTPIVPEVTELKFKTAVLTSTGNEGELKVKAEVNGTVGTIYYVIIKEGTAPTKEQIVAGVNYGTVVVVKKGDSGSAQTLETVLTGLEAGAEYSAHFVIKSEAVFSDIVSKTATTYKTPIDKGEGTAENPFKISTAEDLAAVGVGTYDVYDLEFSKTACYVLTNDIDLSTVCSATAGSWVPINIDTPAVFDGAGYTISNLYINTTEASTPQGLFGLINNGATVKNLKLDGVSITSNAFVEEIKNSNGDKVQLASGSYVGALTGDLKGCVEDIIIHNATITSTGSRVGGLAGRAYADEKTAITVSRVEVEATISGVGRLGGIVGLVDSKDGTSETLFVRPVFKDITFKGTLTGTNAVTTIEGVEYTTAAQYVGGGFGYFRAAEIKNIVVEATINANKHSGGIVGFMQKRSTSSPFEVTLSAGLFKGSVTVETGSNCAAIVGNKSVSNGAEISASGFYTLDSTFSTTTPSTSAVTGVGVELTDLNAAWFAENMSTLDFTTVFTLNETTKLPCLKW